MTKRWRAQERRTDKEVIAAACQGDEEASRILYERYAPRLNAVIRRLAGDDALAEDCAQDAWLRIFAALPEYRGAAQFSTWIHRIAVNSALMDLRARARAARKREILNESAADGARAVELAEPDPTLRAHVVRALAHLPARMREILLLHDMEEYSHDEIAALLSIGSSSVRSQLFRARARMRELLRDRLQDSLEQEHVTCKR